MPTLPGALAVVAGVVASLVLPSRALWSEESNWPRFLGANGVAVSDNPKLPDRWSKTDNVEWVTTLTGIGWSSPIVWGSRVFLTGAESASAMKEPSLGTDFSNDYIAELRAQGLESDVINERLYARDREMPDELEIRIKLYCYDLETGKKLWERQIYDGHPKGGRHRKNSWASETPVTDGERVYVYSTQLGLYAFDFDGAPVWSRPLEAHPTVRDFGTGASPALMDDRLIVVNDNEEESFIAAFDKKTGEQVWRTARAADTRRKTSWSTPFIWDNALGREIVTNGPGAVTSYDVNGEPLWYMKRTSQTAIQSPFAWKDLLIVASGSSGGQDRPLAAIRAGGSGDITPEGTSTTSDYVAWYDRIAGGTYLPTPLVYDDALYVLYEKGIFARFDLETGKRVFRARVAPGAAAFTASPWAYNGKIFVLGEEGDTFVIEAGESYKLLHVNELEDWAMASPAIVGDRLLIRTRSFLYSIRSAE